MTSPSIDALLGRPRNPETGRALVRWVADLRARIARGEIEIGILSAGELGQVAALRAAVECGVTDAWLDLAAWFTAPPVGEPDLAQAEVALRQAAAAGAPCSRPPHRPRVRDGS